jgi:hypothetical protein
LICPSLSNSLYLFINVSSISPTCPSSFPEQNISTHYLIEHQSRFRTRRSPSDTVSDTRALAANQFICHFQ